MYVISIAGWRRRFGPLLRTLLIASAVLWALFFAYRWFIPNVPALAPGRDEGLPVGDRPAGEIVLCAEILETTDGMHKFSIERS